MVTQHCLRSSVLSFCVCVCVGESGSDGLHVSLQAPRHVHDADASGHGAQAGQHGSHPAVQPGRHPV